MIKQPFFALVSAVLLVVLIGYVYERLAFLNKAIHTTGTVVDVSSYNKTCGRRRSRHACTKYVAKVRFQNIAGKAHVLKISAGSKRGYNMPLSSADYHVNDPAKVVYDPENNDTAYEDSFWGVWSGPIMVFIFQILFFFFSLFEPKRRQEHYFVAPEKKPSSI